jgi:hypothetical protein
MSTLVRRRSMAHAFLALLYFGASTTTADDSKSIFKITLGKRDDVAAIRADKDKATVTVESPFGISRMDLERRAENWPKVVVVRLRVKGLENFKVTSGKTRLEGAAGVRDGKPEVRLWKDGDEKAPLDAKSPFWVKVNIVDGAGQAAKEVPVKDGFFELTLPAALFEGNPKSITVSWIDFYRT